jgi:hypothetical protein
MQFHYQEQGGANEKQTGGEWIRRFMVRHEVAPYVDALALVRRSPGHAASAGIGTKTDAEAIGKVG